MVGYADFSGDPTPDIVWQNTQTGEVGYWQMDGGQFLDYVQIDPPDIVSLSWRVVGTPDLFGDGNNEILWQNEQTGEVGFWTILNSQVSAYTQIIPPGTIGSGWQIVGTPDFFGTGTPELLWQNQHTGEIGYWMLNNGAFAGYTQIMPPGVIPTVWQVVATPDITGNGESDIVWQNTHTGEVGYWIMNNGAFVSYTQIEPPGIVPTGWQVHGAL